MTTATTTAALTEPHPAPDATHAASRARLRATVADARHLLGLTVTIPSHHGTYHVMNLATADDGSATLTLMDTDGQHFTAPAEGAEVTSTDLVHYAARVKAADLRARRDGLLTQARAKVPGTRITAEAPDHDADALRAEITALREFIDRPTPGLHTDTYNEDWDGPNVDPTNV